VNVLGPNLVNILLVLFVAFKLAGIITWSWLWVLSPIWISAALVFVGAVIGAVIKNGEET